MLTAPEPAHVDPLSTIEDNLEDLVRQAAGPIVAPALAILAGLATEGWEVPAAEPPGLFHDLRPSEALELRELVEEWINATVLEVEAVITGNLAGAAAIFASRHPDLAVGDWRAREYAGD